VALEHSIEIRGLQQNFVTPFGGNLYSADRIDFQLVGNWTGTVKFECSLDGENWVPIGAYPIGTGGGHGNESAVTESTGPGFFAIPGHPFHFRLNCGSPFVGNGEVIFDLIQDKQS